MSYLSGVLFRNRMLGYILVAMVAVFLAYCASHWWPAFCLIFGHVMISVLIRNLEVNQIQPKYSIYVYPLTAGSSLVFFILLLQFTLSVSLGWRGFLHLSDIATTSWFFLLALLAPAYGCWLLALQQIQALQLKEPERRRRLVLLALTALLLALISMAPFIVIGYLPLALSLAILLFSMDIYLESNRTSMTWLLLWLLLISLVMASFAFKKSQYIDLQVHQQIAQDIYLQGEPDTSRRYHMPIRWDTLSLPTAHQQLGKEQLAIAAGAGQQWQDANNTYWVWHRPDGAGFIIVGRLTGGARPLLALMSLLFLAGLLYCLLLRAISWALKYPYQTWLLPLYGPSSLRVRIQLSFFALVLVAFLLVAWFTVGFFQGKPELQDWLEQLLTLYAFLLLIAGALGILLANSITDPIVNIGDKLSSTQLMNNQPLHWPKEDEIGRLVSHYNQMISDLNDSALKLAASEREGAWREMAKQVAHEIKNPLTPMKLQLQQLVRLEKEDPEKAREWSKIVAKRIIEQIDSLAHIADEFSHFARLPAAKAIEFDLRDLVKSVFELHRVNENNIALSLFNSPEACCVFADRGQLLRVANNLIKNAIQAIGQQENGEIVIRLSTQDNHALLTIADNGPGIDETIKGRIFEPNFTTKSSGMGLGLAMCKNIIEQAEGQISFTTELGLGTTFSVRLPLVAIAQTV